MDGLAGIWPSSRTCIGATPLGDAWPCKSMLPSPPAQPWETIVPFHKLTQWLAYSLMTPMSKLLHIHFAGADLLTGLPEYRNGGLLIDTGLLTLKDEDMARGLEAYKLNSRVEGQPSMEVVPLFTTDDDVIVEWRAVTVGFLDELLGEVNAILGLYKSEGLTLAQMLEAGTWKVGSLSHCFCCEIGIGLTGCVNGTGRKGISPGLEAEYAGPADYDFVGRHGVLGTLDPLYSHALLLITARSNSVPFHFISVYNVGQGGQVGPGGGNLHPAIWRISLIFKERARRGGGSFKFPHLQRF